VSTGSGREESLSWPACSRWASAGVHMLADAVIGYVPEAAILGFRASADAECAVAPESAGRMGIVLPARVAWFCGGAGVGSGAWVPA
jgi:hypothetical protein